MKRRKVPLRMCIGCRGMKPKQELIRVVKSSGGNIDIDLNGKTPGRGAYICHDLQCFERIKKHNLLEHTFNQKIDESIYEHINDLLIEGDKNQ